jgi:hypothetical protein
MAYRIKLLLSQAACLLIAVAIASEFDPPRRSGRSIVIGAAVAIGWITPPIVLAILRRYRK